MSLISNISTSHRNGITYITFDKVVGGGITFDVYRSQSQITSLSGLTKIATLDQDSYRLLYDDSAVTDGQNLTSGLIVTNNGSHLASSKGFIAVTTHSDETGNWYYAITNSGDATITVGTNSLTNPVAETYAPVPGGVLLGTEVVGSFTVRKFFRWEDIRLWDSSVLGYYGKRVNVCVPNSGISAPFPISLNLHAAPQQGYYEPVDGVEGDDVNNGVVIVPRELDYGGINDPYTGGHLASFVWLGKYDAVSDLWKTWSVNRLNAYVKLTRDNAWGDSYDYQADSNRCYIYGGSMGSAGIHIAGHYPEIYAAAFAYVPWSDSTVYGIGNTTKKVNASDGETMADWSDLAYQAIHANLPPLIHIVGSSDATLSPVNWPTVVANYESYNQCNYFEWKNGGHETTGPLSHTQWDHKRFKKNEAYPAFGNASTSDAVPTFPGAFAGNRNGTLDWHSSLHSITGGSAIVDSSNSFAISLISSSAASCKLTLKNIQLFRPSGVSWSTDNGQSGSATINADHSITIASINIPTSAMRLTLTESSPKVSWLRA